MFQTHTRIIESYLQSLVKGYANSFVLVSPAGLGKTTLTLNLMDKLELVKDKNYIYSTSYITPLELFLLFQRVNQLEKPKLLILDDIEFVLQNKQVISLLKSALWSTPNNKRQVDYLSSTYKIKDNKIEDFQGRIVFLLNEFKINNPLIQALKDRGLFYEMQPSQEEILKAMMKLVKLPYQNLKEGERFKIYYFIKQNANSLLSLRTLIKCYNLYLANRNNWREVIRSLVVNQPVDKPKRTSQLLTIDKQVLI